MFKVYAKAALKTVWQLTFGNDRGSVTVDQTWALRFHDNLMLCMQQFESEVEQTAAPGMIHRDVHAQIDHHERLGAVVANDIISPFGQTRILNPGHSRRACTLQSSDAAVLVSDEHSLRAMVQPQNGYTMTIAGAIKRRADLHVIQALTGTATTAAVTTGSGVPTYSTQAMLSAHTIGGATATDLNRIINANELLSKKGCPSGGRYFLYSPGQLRDILAITQASSSDFTKNQIHDKGTIDDVTWEGFKFIEIPDVIDADGSTVLGRMLALSSVTRDCIAYHSNAFGLSYGKAVGAPSIAIRYDLNEAIQVRQTMMMAAVRVWEGAVVKVQCLEN